MSLISRLFKGGLSKSAKSNAEKTAVAPKPVVIDPAELPFAEQLQQLARGSDDSKLQGAARRRIAELLDAGDIELSAVQGAFSEQSLLLAIAALSQQQDLQQQLLADISDQQTLYQLATEGASARLRKLAAERVDQRELLEQLLKHSKSSDKAVYKLVKQRCDAFREHDKLAAERAAQQQALCADVEKLSQHPNEPQFQSRFIHYQQQWDGLKEHAIADASAIEAALAACQGVIDARLQAEAEAQAQIQAVAAAGDNRRQLISQLQQLIAEVYAESEIDSEIEQAVFSRLKDCQQQWQSLSDLSKPAATEEADFKRHCSALESLLSQLKSSGGLLKQLASLSAAADDQRGKMTTELSSCLAAAELIAEIDRAELLQQAWAAVADYRQQKATAASARSQAESALSGLIRRGNAAVEQGHMKQASGIARVIEDKLALIEKLPSHLEKHLETFQASLAKIRDWQQYAVMPKLEAAVEQMEGLVTTSMPADALALKIRKLQDDWKSLSQGGGDQYQELWQRFHDAAQKAYEPCKIYFDELAEQRAKNLEYRKQLLSQLQDYGRDNDWESADWKAVENLLRAAKQQWRDFSPVDRNANKSLQKRFDKFLDSLHDKLGGEYQRNIKLKQQLVNRAEAALAKEDVFAAIDEVKALQPQWKTIGVTRRREDQKLWQQFRGHCDAVFERRQQQTDAFKAELGEHQQQAQSLIADLKSLSELKDQELLAARERRDQLQDEFYDLGELPKTAAKKIQGQFRDATQSFDEAIEAHHQQQQQRCWDDLFLAADALRRCELAGGAESVLSEAQSAIDAVAQWPKTGESAIKNRLLSVAGELDIAANEASLRELCIRMEILKGFDSPEEDGSARMAYQVERLQKGMGQGVNVDTAEQLMVDWVAVHAVADDVYGKLFSRLMAANS